MNKYATKSSNILRLRVICENIVLNVSVVTVSFLFSRIVIMDSHFPFGVSIASAVPRGKMFYSIIGVMLGYVLTAQTAISVRYLACVTSIIIIRWVFSDFKKIKEHDAYTLLVPFIPCLVTGFSLGYASGLDKESFLGYVLESVFVSGMAYAFKKIFYFFQQENVGKEALISVLVSGGAIIIPFLDVNIFGISIFKPILISSVLLSALIGGVTYGSVSGITQGILYSLAGNAENPVLCFFCTPGAMISGIFAPLGKFAVCTIYLFVNLIVYFQCKIPVRTNYIYEQLIGMTIFMIIPRSFSENLKKIFKKEKIIKSSAFGMFVLQNLELITYNFRKINEIIEFYSKKFKSKDTPNNDSQILIRHQVESIEQICSNVCQKLGDEKLFDEEISAKIKTKVQRITVCETSVFCEKDNLGKIFVQISCSKSRIQLLQEIDEISEEVAFICGKTFCAPELFFVENKTVIRYCEKTIFRANVKSDQHSFHNLKCCGDNFIYFNDGFGNFFSIISDGMGTGELACENGAITTQIMGSMIKCGIDFESAINLTNSALIVKSKDESLATIDIFSLNLFTGNAKFFKAGAAASFLRTKGIVKIINSETLPIGILPTVNFKEIDLNLMEGDLILMVSDGTTDAGNDDGWIIEELKNNSYKEDVSRKIVRIATQKRQEEDDDITAVGIYVTRN
ncbi:MAG: SpoIIE family protein phosphatase [Oscillospiraceae bacterium]|jgi:hypothetical protein|nr:SpoIIE family protein phosphatase [Oscillospiraceae bacterium]